MVRSHPNLLDSMTPAQYHDLKFNIKALPDVAKAGHLSASVISKSRDPILFLKEAEDEGTGAMRWGSLIDCMWTTPELFQATYAVMPKDTPRRPTEAQKNAKKPSESTVASIAWWNKWENDCKGKILVSQEDHANAVEAVHMLDIHPIARKLKDTSKKQVAIIGEPHPELYLPKGSKVKSLHDLIPIEGEFADCAVDLKTTNSLSENLLHNTMFGFDYPVKMAFYNLALEQGGYGLRKRILFIWQRSKKPYDVVVREMPDQQLAKSVLQRRCERLQRMDPNDITSHFDTSITKIHLKEWAILEYSSG